MTDGNSLMIGGLAIIVILTVYGIILGKEQTNTNSTPAKPGGQILPRPSPAPPAGIKSDIEREFNELRDMLNILLNTEHHRFLEITKFHIYTLLDGYEHKCKDAIANHGKDIEAWKDKIAEKE